MTSNPITCDPKDTLAEAMGKMARHHVGQLPVVDGSELVGVVSIGDLVKSLNEQVEAENRHLMDYLHGLLRRTADRPIQCGLWQRFVLFIHTSQIIH